MKKLLMPLIAFFLFFTPVHAENREWVVDEEGILNQSEVEALNAEIDSLVETYDMGIYIRLKPNMDGYLDIERYSEAVYLNESLGLGSENSGLLLIMEFDERNYDIAAFGNGNIAFTDYGKAHLGEMMLPSFRYGNWYEGFTYYLRGVEMELEQYQAGTPYDRPGSQGYQEDTESRMPLYVTFGAPPIISLLICIALASKHRTAKEAVYARSYVKGGGLSLTRHLDRYTHTTRTVTHIPRNDRSGGGGGTSINSGGFSHSSGKF